MSQQKIYFRGAGLLSSLGNGIAENVHALSSGNYAISEVRIDRRDKSYVFPYCSIHSPSIDTGQGRINAIIDQAIDQALSEAGLTDEKIKKMGLFVGSTSFDIYSAELDIKAKGADAENIAKTIPAFTGLSEYIVKSRNLKGPVFTFNTACTSSANAVMYAADFIRRGEIEHALVIGMEFFNEMSVLGFSSLELISKQGMQPFSHQRDGLVLGEACGALVLGAEAEEHAFSYLAGANLSDTHSITACKPDGSTVAKVIQHVLAAAHLEAEDIQLVKAHGTASLSNDEAEAYGLQQVFERVPPVVVLKPMIGHTLGACGVVELILFYQSLLHQHVPALKNDQSVASEFKLDLVKENQQIGAGYFLLNYFGFGGNNTTLIISND